MTDLLIIISVIAIISFTVMFILLSRGLLEEAKKVGKASEDISKLTSSINEQITPTVEDIKASLRSINAVVSEASNTINHANQLIDSTDKLIRFNKVTNVLKSSAANLINVYDGIRKGIKNSRDPKKP
jgi:uncharacterized protein YukE